jgi:hypothetical protein
MVGSRTRAGCHPGAWHKKRPLASTLVLKCTPLRTPIGPRKIIGTRERAGQQDRHDRSLFLRPTVILPT